MSKTKPNPKDSGENQVESREYCCQCGRKAYTANLCESCYDQAQVLRARAAESLILDMYALEDEGPAEAWIQVGVHGTETEQKHLLMVLLAQWPWMSQVNPPLQDGDAYIVYLGGVGVRYNGNPHAEYTLTKDGLKKFDVEEWNRFILAATVRP